MQWLSRQLGPGGIRSLRACGTDRLRPCILLLVRCRPRLSFEQLLSLQFLLLHSQLLELLLAQILLELRLRVAGLGLGPGRQARSGRSSLLRQPLFEQQLLLLLHLLQLLLLLQTSMQVFGLHLLLQARVLPRCWQRRRRLKLRHRVSVHRLHILPWRAVEGQAGSEAPTGLTLAARPVNQQFSMVIHAVHQTAIVVSISIVY